MTKTMELEYIDRMYNPLTPRLLVIWDGGKDRIALKEVRIPKTLVYASKEERQKDFELNRPKKKE